MEKEWNVLWAPMESIQAGDVEPDSIYIFNLCKKFTLCLFAQGLVQKKKNALEVMTMQSSENVF